MNKLKINTNKVIIKCITVLAVLLFVFQILSSIATYAATPENVTTKYEIRNDVIMKVVAGTTVTQFLNNITVGSSTTKAVYNGSAQVTGSTELATGMTLKAGTDTYKIAVRGDANGDGKLTATDLSQFKMHFTNIKELTSPNVEAIDINYDGQITTVDLSQLKMLLVGLDLQTGDQPSEPDQPGEPEQPVQPATVVGVEIKTQPTKTSYTEGQVLDLTGLVVTLTYSDGSTEDVTYSATNFADKGITISPANGDILTVADNNANSVALTVNGKTVATNNLAVETGEPENPVVAGEIGMVPNTTGSVKELEITIEWPESIEGLTKEVSIDGGNTFNPYTGEITVTENGIVIARLVDGDNNVIKIASLTVTNIDNEEPEILVPPVTVVGVEIKVQPTKTSYVEGQALDLTGLVLTLTYSDGSTEDVEYSEASFADKGITISPANGDILTVADNDTNSVTLTVNGKTVETNDLTVQVEEPVAVTGEINIVPNTTGSVKELGITIDWPENIEGLTKEISIDGGNTFNPYTGEITITENGTVIARLVDSDNNVIKIASLTVTNIDNEEPATLTIASITVKTQPTNTSYIEGQMLDLTGLVITLTYDNGTSEDVTYSATNFTDKGITVNPANGVQLSMASNNGKPVTLTCNSKTANTSNITVSAKTVSSITVKSQPTKLSYIEDQTLDLTGLVVTLTYDNGTAEDVTYSVTNFANKGITTNPVNGTQLTIASNNNKPVTLTCNSKPANTSNITVATKSVTSIAVKSQPTKLSYIEDQTLDLTGLVVTLTYDNGTVEGVTYSVTNFTNKGITANPANGTQLTIAGNNNKPVTLTCNSKTATTSNVTVSAKTVSSIEVKSQPTKLSYIEDQTLDLTGLVVTLTYDNGTVEDVTYSVTNFANKGITANPANGTQLAIASNNAKPITITCNGKTATTSNIIVEAPVVTTGFFSTEGKDIIDPTGQTYMIKSIALTNDVWWQPSWRTYRWCRLCSCWYY